MNFNDHSSLSGQHAFLGASKYHWINYSDDKLIEVYTRQQAIQRGVVLHEYAAMCINLKQKLPRSTKSLNSFVNDSIGFEMKPEQILFYSENCFGTADAIGFKNGKLRIHDFKSGQTPASMNQLLVYAALFCLEYIHDPRHIEIETRIYQNDELTISLPEAEVILDIMDKITRFDAIIENIKRGV